MRDIEENKSESDWLTEINMNSAEQSQRSFYENKVKKNNLFKSNASMTSKGHQGPTVKEKMDAAINSWGFKNSETEQLFKQNYMKMQKQRNKKKSGSGMTADEKLERFWKIAK